MKEVTFENGPHHGETAVVDDGEFRYWFRVSDGQRHDGKTKIVCDVYTGGDRDTTFIYRGTMTIPADDWFDSDWYYGTKEQ